MTRYLVDTNVLLRIVDSTNPFYSVARNAEHMLRQQEHELWVAVQNCIEFWSVATRPASRNGLGRSSSRAQSDLAIIEQTFAVLPNSPAVYSMWRQLVVTYNVSGVQVHDAHLVATMLANGVSHILTFNTADFMRYANTGIVVADPAAI